MWLNFKTNILTVKANFNESKNETYQADRLKVKRWTK